MKATCPRCGGTVHGLRRGVDPLPYHINSGSCPATPRKKEEAA